MSIDKVVNRLDNGDLMEESGLIYSDVLNDLSDVCNDWGR